MASDSFIATEKVLKALGNRRRLAIIHLLKNRSSLSVGDIAEHIRLSFAATSRHLRVLASADLVENEQVNTTVNYFLPKNRHLLLDSVLRVF